MSKYYYMLLAGVAALALSACATFNRYKSDAIDLMCANKDTLIAIALANNDLPTVNAIDAYCGTPVPAPVKPVQ